MKKILTNNYFKNYFSQDILLRGEQYYKNGRILDIWYQDNRIKSYIGGKEIYKIELEIENNEIKKSYCSCPYSEDGQYLCKHIAAVTYYLNENEIPELEPTNKKQDNNELKKIYDEMDYEVRKISDKHGFINYYNGRYFVDLVKKVSEYIDNYIDNENYKDAFELIKYTYQFIQDVFMDGSNGEYQQSFYIINENASRLISNEEYYKIFLNYAYEINNNNSLGDFSDSPLHAFIIYAHDKKTAKKVIDILENIEINDGIFVDIIKDKIILTYDYISKEQAIKLCYKNIEHYGVKEMLIKYLKQENRIDEAIKILKNDIQNHIRKDMIYDKLLSIYDENNMLDEKKKILPEVIIETSNFEKYKELKKMCKESEWKELKERIIPNLEQNKNYILLDIYMEEKETDKLFEQIIKKPNIFILKKYQDGVKDKYNDELLNLYKIQIIEQSKNASDRNYYQQLCDCIKKMGELKNSEDFIFEMLKEMYPNYKNKRAFKEEIINALSNQNKVRFYELIRKKVK